MVGMNMEQHLQNREQQINEDKLDQSYYFQALLQEVINHQLLSEQQIKRLQIELVELMGKEAARYTNEESSSIPVEKAQELLQSITYCIGIYLKTIRDGKEKLRLLQNESIQTLFLKGMEEIAKRKEEASKLLEQLQKKALDLNNIAYQDTIHHDLPKFFHDYEIEFGAHKLDTGIDYPLLRPITEYLGMEYVEEYLKQLAMEDEFIGRFRADRINLLLQAFDKETEHMLINIYELVWTNVLGCWLADKNIYELELRNSDLVWLQDKLQDLSEKELFFKLEQVFTQISDELALKEEEKCYGRGYLREAAIRLKHCLKQHAISKFFISFREPRSMNLDSIEDGKNMENKELRELIHRMGEVSDLKGKVALIKDQVRSIEDLMVILNSCFYDDEFAEVFSMLGESELTVLKKYILSDRGGIEIEDFDTETNWQKILLKL
jgi:hypothetical protein